MKQLPPAHANRSNAADWMIQRVRELPQSQGADIPAAAITALARRDDRGLVLRSE